MFEGLKIKKYRLEYKIGRKNPVRAKKNSLKRNGRKIPTVRNINGNPKNTFG